MEKSVKCCYLVCAGEMKTPLNIEKKPFDKIIAVDGGLKRLRQAGIDVSFKHLRLPTSEPV